MDTAILADFDPFLREIGRLVVNFNALEHAIRRCACALIDHRDERVGQIVLDIAGAARIEEILRALAPHRIDESLLRDRVLTTANAFASVRLRRNDFAHGIWRVPNEATDLSQVEAAKAPNRKREPVVVAGSSDAREIAMVASQVAAQIEPAHNLFVDVSKYLALAGSRADS